MKTSGVGLAKGLDQRRGRRRIWRDDRRWRDTGRVNADQDVQAVDFHGSRPPNTGTPEMEHDDGLMGDDETPPPITNWPEDRDELIRAVWRMGVQTGRFFQLRDELKKAQTRSEAHAALDGINKRISRMEADIKRNGD